MKIPWGSPAVIRMRLIIVAVVIFVLAVFFWPQQKVMYFSLNPGEGTTVTFAGKDFDYNLCVHSVDASTKTADISVFIPAYSAYSVPGGSYQICLEQNQAVTLSNFREGQIYEFMEGSNGGPLFKLEHTDYETALFSVVDSWTGDNPETQNILLNLNPTAPNASPTVSTDKAKYDQGETVNISITNDTGSDIEMCSNLYRIGQMNYSDGRIEWRQLIISNPGYTANQTFVLHAGESVSASWNQTEQVWSSNGNVTEAVQVAPGRYKIEAIPFTDNSSSISMAYIDSCYSAPPQFPLDESDYSVIIEIE
jgi:hypothetical protein